MLQGGLFKYQSLWEQCNEGLPTCKRFPGCFWWSPHQQTCIVCLSVFLCAWIYVCLCDSYFSVIMLLLAFVVGTCNCICKFVIFLFVLLRNKIYSILFYSILFYSILFYSILFITKIPNILKTVDLWHIVFL